jgi:CheY-like chemotaxis protein
MLKPLGFEIIEAEDGRQAVRLANEVRPDLILMDRWMPVMNGLEAVGRIRKVSELEGVPIIAISASVSKEDQVLIRDSGYDAFLPKPIQWPRMAALLEEHLKLEWEYEVQGDPAGEPDDEKEDEVEDITPPPKEELAVLHDLAVMGDMQGILQRLADIETMGREYIPFADKLRRLAENYESGTIRVLVQEYLERDI